MGTAIKEIQYKRLGIIDYQNAYKKQKELVEQIIQGQRESTILFCEHPAVITLGKRSKEENLYINRQELKEKHLIQVYEIDRGGDVTIHSPGQLIIYPIIDLKQWKKDIHLYLYQLEQVSIDLFKHFDIFTERKRNKTGVWYQHKKITSIGIGIRRWVSYHGIGININTDLKKFRYINPCGLNAEMTSLQEIKQNRIEMEEIIKKVIVEIENNFEWKMIEDK